MTPPSSLSELIHSRPPGSLRGLRRLCGICTGPLRESRWWPRTVFGISSGRARELELLEGSATRGNRGLARKYARGPERAGEWAGGRTGMGPGSNPANPPRLGAVAASEWDASPPSPGPVEGSSSRAEPTGRKPSESRTPEESIAGSSPGSHTPPDSGWPGPVAWARHRIRPVGSSEARAREGELHAGRPHPVENSDRRGIP